MIYRPYNPETDEKSAIRLWKESGWADLKKNRKTRDAFRRWVAGGTADVAEHRGNAESMVTTHRGSIRFLDTDLPFRAVTSVLTGRPLRRMGTAGELTARAVMRAALEGDAAAGLGIFDQGFYDKLGFGNFPYTRWVTLDPLSLEVPALTRPPIRLSAKDSIRMAKNIAERRTHHGMVGITAPEFTEMQMMEAEDGFGLGFEDSEGGLSHHFFAKPEGENGPYEIWWMAYKDHSGLMELLSLIRNLGDQVNAFTLQEPYGIQIQDLLSRPFRMREITGGSKYRNTMRSSSYTQIRILDLPRTLEALRLPAGHIRFNLELRDPITDRLPADARWRGVAGDWTVELDDQGSSAVNNRTPGLPKMKASINAFTRLVFGVVPAAGLAFSDELEAPEDLLDELDRKLRLPRPDAMLDF